MPRSLKAFIQIDNQGPADLNPGDELKTHSMGVMNGVGIPA